MEPARAQSIGTLAKIANREEYGVILNPELGEIRYPLGDTGKKGFGFLHIVEQRMRKDGATLGEAIDIAVRVGEAAAQGKETGKNFNTRHLDYGITRAIVATDKNGNNIITGYEIRADAAPDAHRRSEGLHASPHASSDEVVAALKDTVARERKFSSQLPTLDDYVNSLEATPMQRGRVRKILEARGRAPFIERHARNADFGVTAEPKELPYGQRMKAADEIAGMLRSSANENAVEKHFANSRFAAVFRTPEFLEWKSGMKGMDFHGAQPLEDAAVQSIASAYESSLGLGDEYHLQEKGRPDFYIITKAEADYFAFLRKALEGKRKGVQAEEMEKQIDKGMSSILLWHEGIRMGQSGLRRLEKEISGTEAELERSDARLARLGEETGKERKWRRARAGLAAMEAAGQLARIEKAIGDGGIPAGSLVELAELMAGFRSRAAFVREFVRERKREALGKPDMSVRMRTLDSDRLNAVFGQLSVIFRVLAPAYGNSARRHINAARAMELVGESRVGAVMRNRIGAPGREGEVRLFDGVRAEGKNIMDALVDVVRHFGELRKDGQPTSRALGKVANAQRALESLDRLNRYVAVARRINRAQRMATDFIRSMRVGVLNRDAGRIDGAALNALKEVQRAVTRGNVAVPESGGA